MEQNEHIEEGGATGDVVIETVIPELERVMGANWNLLSPERKKQLQDIHTEKTKAAKEFVIENGGKLDNQEEGGQQQQGAAPAAAAKPASNEGADAVEGDKEKGENVFDEFNKKPNALGIKIGAKKEKTADAVVIEKSEDVLAFINKQYGMDLKDIKELPKFFESVNKFRADSQKLPDTEKQANQFKKIFENLDPTLLKAVQAFYDGKDYLPIINDKPVFNFNLPADKQDQKKLITHYFKDKFTAEQLETLGTDDQDPALGIAIEASKDKYSIEKQSRDNEVATYEQEASKRVTSFNASVESSIGVLETSFPEVDQTAKSRVRQTMAGGIRSVIDVFCNPDGTYKPGAAEQLLLAQDGKAIIFEMMSAAERSAETRVNEEIANRGGGKKPAGSGNGGGQELSPEAKQKLAGLNALKRKM